MFTNLRLWCPGFKAILTEWAVSPLPLLVVLTATGTSTRVGPVSMPATGTPSAGLPVQQFHYQVAGIPTSSKAQRLTMTRTPMAIPTAHRQVCAVSLD